MEKKRYIIIEVLKAKLPMYMDCFLRRISARYDNSYWDSPGEMMKAITQFIEKYKLEYMVNIRYTVAEDHIMVKNLTGKQNLLFIRLENKNHDQEIY